MRQAILKHLVEKKDNFSLPSEFYNIDEVYQAELKDIWYKNWIFVAHDAETPNKGDYLCFSLGEYSIVIVNSGSSINAFINSCPTSGEKLCDESSGNIKDLGKYNLKGKSNKKSKVTDLEPLALECIESYVFVSLAKEPPSFDEFRKTATPYMSPHKTDYLKVASQSVITEYGNWKLVVENNRECYHCAGNHPELTITFPENPAYTGTLPGHEIPKEVTEHWDECEKNGLPSFFKIAENGEYRVARIPLIKDFNSYTMSGYCAVDKPLIEDMQKPGSLLMFYYPNSWNHFLKDHIVSFRMLPIGPQETQVTTTWLVHKDAVEGINYDVDRLSEVWNNTNLQDKHLVEESQKGINSPSYEPGPYSKVYEQGLIQFVDWYSKAFAKGMKETMSEEMKRSAKQEAET